MSKQGRNILTMGIAVVVLVGLLLAVIFLLKKPETDDSSSDTSSDEESFVVLDKSVDADGNAVETPVKKVVFKSEEKEFLLELNNKNNLYVKEYSELPLDLVVSESTSAQVSKIIAKRKFEDVNLSDFGLDNPKNQIVVTYHDDKVITINVGEATPLEDGNYLSLDGSKDVYIVTTAVLESLTKKEVDFIDKAIIAYAPESDGKETSEAVLRDMKLSGTVREDKPVSIRMINDKDPKEFMSFEYVITSPSLVGAEAEITDAFASNAATLTAHSVYIPHPTEEELKEVGLDNPYSVCEMTLSLKNSEEDDNGNTSVSFSNDEKHTIKLGKQDDNGNYYALIDDIDVIYRLSDTSVPWADKVYGDIVSRLLFYYNISTVSKIEITEGSDTTAFNLEHFDKEGEESDDDLKVTVGGEVKDTDSFRKLYQRLMLINRYGVADEKPTADPEVVIKIYFSDAESKPFVAEFYKKSGSLYTCISQENDIYTVSVRSVEQLIGSMNDYLEGKTLE